MPPTPKTPQDVYAIARAHDDTYLLLRPVSEDNDQNRACRALVESGHAVWIPWHSSLAPGIRLTGRPREQSQPE